MSVPAHAMLEAASGVYRCLMSGAGGELNDHLLACMIGSWQSGAGAMPDWLGLPAAEFRCLMAHHFPGAAPDGLVPHGKSIAETRDDEVDELARLMLMTKAGESASEAWMARVVAVGCMGSDHLWQDLGLWSRVDLTALMRRNFPALAARNVKDMKWKRFLYKQLCEAEGIYTCRAPSCEVCTDYRVCFGPED
jgi:nitrogen fixation protein NifQ